VSQWPLKLGYTFPRLIPSSIFLFSCVLLCGACADGNDWSLRSDLDPVVDPVAGVMPDTLVFSHFLGEGVLGDYKGYQATSRDGRLAVEERSECRVSVLDIETGRVAFRVGKCGAGPGEFKTITSLFFSHDTLHVVDAGLNRMTSVSTKGIVLSMVSWSELWGDANVSPSNVAPITDSLLLGLARRPERNAPQVLVLDRSSGQVVQDFGRQPPAVRREPDSYAYRLGACTESRATEPLVILTGAYLFESVAYRLDGTPQWRSATPLDWAGPFRVRGSIGAKSYGLTPICGDSAVMIRMTRTSSEAPRNTPQEEAYYEFRGAHGRLLARGFTEPDDLTLQGAGVSTGGYWMFYDAKSERPRIRVYQLESNRNRGRDIHVAK